MTMDGEVWQFLSSSGTGGIETQTVRMANALSRNGYRSRVVLLDGSPAHAIPTQLAGSGVPVELVTSVMEVARNLRKCRPALVHTRGYKAGVSGRILCRLMGIPVISHYHAGEPGAGRVGLYNKLDALTSVLAPAIAVSAPIAKRLWRDAQVIHNFVELPVECHPGNGRVIAFVGRLSEEKGPDVFCRIAERLPQGSFEIFGDGPMRRDLERRFGGRVGFHGMVSNMAEHWSRVGLLCMPSKHEGLPNAALEAMAHGIPVVAYGVGDLPRLVTDGESGFIIEPQDFDAIASAIATWLETSADWRISMGRAARATIEARHAPEVVLPLIFKVYRDALKRDQAA